MEKQGIPLKGDLTVDNVFDIFQHFLGALTDIPSKLLCCMTSRKDGKREPTFHFVGFCKGLEVSQNEGEKKRFIINLHYSLARNASYGYHEFSTFGNVLHLARIHKITYEMRDKKLIIKYFTRRSKNPSSYLVLQEIEWLELKNGRIE